MSDATGDYCTFFLDGPRIKIPAEEHDVGLGLVDVGGHEFLDLRLAVVLIGIVVQVRVGVGGGVSDEDVHGDVGRLGKPEMEISWRNSRKKYVQPEYRVTTHD